MQFVVVLSVLMVVVSSSLIHRVRRANGDQQPKVWDALDRIRGKAPLGSDEIQQLVASSQAGQDYPTLSAIPPTNVDCSSFKQPGFYADQSNKCQVFHRCDINGNLTSYLCPNMTLFNQITLICDAFYNVDCSQSNQFQDYSNSRLYQENVVLLDNQDEVNVQQATGAVQSQRLSSKNTSKSSSNQSSNQQQAAAKSSVDSGQSEAQSLQQ